MADTEVITIQGGDLFMSYVNKVNRVAPDYLFNAIQLAGTRMKNEVVQKTFSKVKNRTGHLRGGYVRKAYQEGVGANRRFYCDVSGGFNSACHYHLIENGHKRVFQETYFNGHFVRISPGFTEGIHTMHETIDEWNRDKRVVDYAEKAIQKALREGLI